MMAKLLRSRTTTLVLLALVATFGIHFATRATENLRADFTANSLYSLSEGTREILTDLKQEGVKPIELTLFFSETTGKTLPKFVKDFISYDRYLRALLREYALASQGKIKVAFVDPIPDSDEAQDALDFGLDGKPINQHGDLFFFGLVAQTQTGSREVIDFLWPAEQETVEYEITKRIHSLIWPNKKRVGVLSSLEILADDSNPYMAQILAAQGKTAPDSWLSMKLLQETYDVRPIDLDTDHISRDDYDLVVVVHPKSLGARALWALDEWVVTGGNALVLTDPYALEDRPPENPQQPWLAMQYKPDSDLAPLVQSWGIEREPDQIAADFDLAAVRPTGRRGAAERLVYDLEIADRWLDETTAHDHPIVQGLGNLRFFLAGSLRAYLPNAGDEAEAAQGDGVERTPLITTTARGNTLEVKPGFGGEDTLTFADLNDAGRVRDRFREGNEPVVLAYLLQGQLLSAYPEGASIPSQAPPPPPPGLPPGVQLPPPADGERVQKAAIPEDKRSPATVAVFADVDFISDQVAFQNSIFGVQAVNDNYKVLLNTVDFLLGSQSLMKVRSKQSIQRPFTRFDEIEAAADRETLERERELRAEIATFESQLQETTRNLGTGNAALFQKQVQDEVALLNERIREKNRELRDIRLSKRQAIEAEERRVRRSTLLFTPSLVLVLGLALFYRRSSRDARARRDS